MRYFNTLIYIAKSLAFKFIEYGFMFSGQCINSSMNVICYSVSFKQITFARAVVAVFMKNQLIATDAGRKLSSVVASLTSRAYAVSMACWGATGIATSNAAKV